MKRNSGFTLIELLILIAILGLLAAALLPRIVGSQEKAYHFACSKNLSNIYSLLIDYKGKRQHYPVKSGPKFLLTPWTDKACEHSVQNRDYFFCPAVRMNDPHYVGNVMNAPVDTLWPNIDTITSADTNYAGRRRGDPGVQMNFEKDTECIAADDNEQGSNHGDLDVNMLFGSGAVRQILYAKLEQEGILKKEDAWIPVGPESPVPGLDKLSKD